MLSLLGQILTPRAPLRDGSSISGASSGASAYAAVQQRKQDLETTRQDVQTAVQESSDPAALQTCLQDELQVLTATQDQRLSEAAQLINRGDQVSLQQAADLLVGICQTHSARLEADLQRLRGQATLPAGEEARGRGDRHLGSAEEAAAWGDSAQERSELEAARKDYQQALELQPNDAGTHSRLGLVLFRLGEVDAAITHYRKALELGEATTRPAIHYNLGLAYGRQNNLEQARACFEQAAAQLPDHLDNRYMLAVTLQKLGRSDEALAQFQQLIDRDRDQAFSRPIAGKLKAMAEQLERQVQQAPDRQTLLPALDQAIAAYELLEQVSPADVPSADYHLGLLHSSRAMNTYTISRMIGYDRVTYTAEDIATCNSHFDKAQQALQAVAGDPATGKEVATDAHYQLARIHHARGEWQPATGELAQALKLSPDDPDLLEELARNQAGMGQLEEARQTYQKTIELLKKQLGIAPDKPGEIQAGPHNETQRKQLARLLIDLSVVMSRQAYAASEVYADELRQALRLNVEAQRYDPQNATAAGNIQELNRLSLERPLFEEFSVRYLSNKAAAAYHAASFLSNLAPAVDAKPELKEQWAQFKQHVDELVGTEGSGRPEESLSLQELRLVQEVFQGYPDQTVAGFLGRFPRDLARGEPPLTQEQKDAVLKLYAADESGRLVPNQLGKRLAGALRADGCVPATEEERFRLLGNLLEKSGGSLSINQLGGKDYIPISILTTPDDPHERQKVMHVPLVGGLTPAGDYRVVDPLTNRIYEGKDRQAAMQRFLDENQYPKGLLRYVNDQGQIRERRLPGPDPNVAIADSVMQGWSYVAMGALAVSFVFPPAGIVAATGLAPAAYFAIKGGIDIHDRLQHGQPVTWDMWALEATQVVGVLLGVGAMASTLGTGARAAGALAATGRAASGLARTEAAAGGMTVAQRYVALQRFLLAANIANDTVAAAAMIKQLTDITSRSDVSEEQKMEAIFHTLANLVLSTGLNIHSIQNAGGFKGMQRLATLDDAQFRRFMALPDEHKQAAFKLNDQLFNKFIDLPPGQQKVFLAGLAGRAEQARVEYGMRRVLAQEQGADGLPGIPLDKVRHGDGHRPARLILDGEHVTAIFMDTGEQRVIRPEEFKQLLADNPALAQRPEFQQFRPLTPADLDNVRVQRGESEGLTVPEGGGTSGPRWRVTGLIEEGKIQVESRLEGDTVLVKEYTPEEFFRNNPELGVRDAEAFIQAGGLDGLPRVSRAVHTDPNAGTAARLPAAADAEGRMAVNKAYQDALADVRLVQLDKATRARFEACLNQQGITDSEKILLRRALAAGNDIQDIEAYAAAMSHVRKGDFAAAGLRDETLIRDLKLRELSPEECVLALSTLEGYQQAWDATCNPTSAQIVRGEIDPVYSWKARLEPERLRAEQARLAVENQGTLVPIGTPRQTGKGTTPADIARELNTTLQMERLGMKYSPRSFDESATTVEAGRNRRAQALVDIERGLQQGIPTIIYVQWAPRGGQPGDGHALAVINTRTRNGVREFLIHDPGKQQTVWVSRQDIVNGHLGPAYGKDGKLCGYLAVEKVTPRDGDTTAIPRQVLEGSGMRVGSSDTLFLPREAQEPAPLPPARVDPASPAYRQSSGFQQNHRIDSQERVQDGYVDGGRDMTLGADGSVASHREVLVVDRARDTKLQGYIAEARRITADAPTPEEKALRLARYVDELMNGGMVSRDWADSRVDNWLYGDAFEGRPGRQNTEVLLGDVPGQGGGVCRHRALLFKVLGDEVGLPVSIVRGELRDNGDPRSAGAHVWNEVQLGNGRTVMVDISNPPTDRRGQIAGPFPGTDDAGVARDYKGARGGDLYRPAAAPESRPPAQPEPPPAEGDGGTRVTRPAGRALPPGVDPQRYAQHKIRVMELFLYDVIQEDPVARANLSHLLDIPEAQVGRAKIRFEKQPGELPENAGAKYSGTDNEIVISLKYLDVPSTLLAPTAGHEKQHYYDRAATDDRGQSLQKENRAHLVQAILAQAIERRLNRFQLSPDLRKSDRPYRTGQSGEPGASPARQEYERVIHNLMEHASKGTLDDYVLQTYGSDAADRTQALAAKERELARARQLLLVARNQGKAVVEAQIATLEKELSDLRLKARQEPAVPLPSTPPPPPDPATRLKDFRYSFDLVLYSESRQALGKLKQAGELRGQGRPVEARALLDEARALYQKVLADDTNPQRKLDQAREGLALLDSLRP